MLQFEGKTMEEYEKPKVKIRVALRLIQSNTLQVKSRPVGFTRNCIYKLLNTPMWFAE